MKKPKGVSLEESLFERVKIAARDKRESASKWIEEITLATPTVRAIMRDEELVAMMPPETRIEMERFAEIYV